MRPWTITPSYFIRVIGEYCLQLFGWHSSLHGLVIPQVGGIHLTPRFRFPASRSRKPGTTELATAPPALETGCSKIRASPSQDAGSSKYLRQETSLASIWLSPQRGKQTSGSDEFLLKPAGENNKYASRNGSLGMGYNFTRNQTAGSICQTQPC